MENREPLIERIRNSNIPNLAIVGGIALWFGGVMYLVANAPDQPQPQSNPPVKKSHLPTSAEMDVSTEDLTIIHEGIELEEEIELDIELDNGVLLEETNDLWGTEVPERYPKAENP